MSFINHIQAFKKFTTCKFFCKKIITLFHKVMTFIYNKMIYLFLLSIWPACKKRMINNSYIFSGKFIISLSQIAWLYAFFKITRITVTSYIFKISFKVKALYYKIAYIFYVAILTFFCKPSKKKKCQVSLFITFKPITFI